MLSCDWGRVDCISISMSPSSDIKALGASLLLTLEVGCGWRCKELEENGRDVVVVGVVFCGVGS